MNLDFTSGAANTANSVKEIIFSDNDPTNTTNPSTTDIIWVNRTTGQIFTCLDNTQDNNVWQAIPLNAGGDSNIKHSDADPTATENLSKGTIWVNDTSGKIFICVDDTQDNNIWVDTGNYDGIKHSTNEPTITENLQIGSVWINDTNGKIYICTDDTKDNNVWLGYKPTLKISSSTTDIVDLFKDGSGVALYQLDGNVADTGGRYDGVATDINYDTGKFGQAAVFNGSSSYIDLTNINISGDYSISLWFNLPSISNSSSYPSVFCIDTGSSDDSWTFIISSASGNSGFLGTIGGIHIDTRKDRSWNTNHFYNMVFSVKGGDSLKIYIDGNLLETNDLSSSSNINLKDLYLGFGVGFPSGNETKTYVESSIDELRIFNRALTDDEINQLYNEK